MCQTNPVKTMGQWQWKRKPAHSSKFAAIFYETSENCTNLGTWQPGQFGRGEERNAEVPEECSNFLSCVQTLGTDYGKWKRKPANSSRMLQLCFQTTVDCTNLGTWLPGQFGRGGGENVVVPAECRNSLSDCKKDAKILHCSLA